jgi:hypothetical protein
MAVKTSTIIASIAVALAIGTGGYFANEWRVCSGLEEDYLDRIYSIRSNARADSLAASVGVKVDTEERRELQDRTFMLLERQGDNFVDRCGYDAWEDASRKGEDIMYGS